MTEVVWTEKSHDVWTVWLDDPSQRNSLTYEARLALAEQIGAAAREPACRAIILAGKGGHFCSGGNMKSDVSVDEDPSVRTPRRLRALHRMINAILHADKPVIAAVEGAVYGAGLSLACACDFIIAHPNAKFCASFGKVGLLPDGGLLWSLPRRVGPSRAQQMMISASTLDAAEAYRIQLVDEIAAQDDVMTAALAAAKRFRAVAPLASAHVRRELLSAPLSLEAAFEAELRIQPVLAASQDYEEGRTAFAQKRMPRFVGL